MESSRNLRDVFEAAGQGQVFRFWDRLNEAQRASLLSQAREIDLREVQHLVDTLVKGQGEHGVDLSDLEPHPYVSLPERGGDAEAWRRARAAGEAALREGRLAAFTVAGGQGTRLGYDGPKGTFPVTPVKRKVLFHVFADKLRAAQEAFGKTIPWFIMTSHANHEATRDAFEEAGYYGLQADDVFFFTQGRMPAVDPEGRILLEAPDRIAMSPDGHGGSLRALVRSGATERMKARGCDTITYFQVDNPLVRVVDPAFIGFHLLAEADMSSKMIPKAYPEEKLGHFCRQRDRLVVIEYSDLPVAMQQERTASGELRFIAGSIAIHILSVDFVERMGGARSLLPFHRAHKKIAVADAEGRSVTPDKPNGYKFEMFVFDALPHAERTVVVETRREDDFSPVKNAEGLDSPKTCRDDQLRQFARWVRAAGVDLPVDDSGLPPFAFEISPLFADSEEAFVAAWQALREKPVLREGTYLDRAP